MMFLSLVGTQVMAVLNPVLSLRDGRMMPDRIVLLTTLASEKRARTIAEYLENIGFRGSAIEVIPVSDGMERDAAGRRPAHETVEDLVRDEPSIVFNLAGAMSFQVAACVQRIPMDASLLLYPESSCVHAIRIDRHRISHHDRLPLPKPVDVLRLQGVSASTVRQGNSEFLHYVMKKWGVALPQGCNRHVRIADVVFELVWNRGNELRFLAVIHGGKSDGKTGEDYRREARRVIDLASARTTFGELYHRKLAVLTNIDDVAERIRTEGGGKVEVIHVPVRDENAMAVRGDLTRLFGAGGKIVSAGRRVSEETGNRVGSNDAVLYTVIGRNLMPSLVALWSHRPSAVCFLYTPGDELIETYLDRLLEAKEDLPVGRLSVWPVGVSGDAILDLPPPGHPAGTKGQAAFLALWARLHGFGVFSIRNDSGRLENLGDGEQHPLSGPSPSTYIRLTGARMRPGDDGVNAAALMRDRNQYEIILNLIRAIQRDDPDRINDFPHREISIRELRYVPPPDGGDDARIHLDDGNAVICAIDRNGEWLERLVGYVLLECGADEVQVRVRTRWEEETEARLQKTHHEDVHMTDIDVAARFGADYFIVSVKSSKKQRVGETTAEARAFARLLGRFCVPLVCFLRHGGPPTEAENGVFCFGYQTLVDREAMKELLDMAIQGRRTTGGRTTT